jgi:hypothetical protein
LTPRSAKQADHAVEGFLARDLVLTTSPVFVKSIEVNE